MTFRAEIEELAPGRARRYRLIRNGRLLAANEAHAALEQEAGFRDFLSHTLAAAPWEAFFWETPPVVEASLARPFEFVLTDSPVLAARQADPAPFAAQFGATAIAAFESLGGDARLIAPSPQAPAAVYPHLARFLRDGPERQIDALWRTVGAAMREQVGAAPRWLSTSGLGVSWLHVRIDSRPKYYVHAPYRAAP